MSTERWQHLEQLFEAASRLGPAERPAWLAEACGDDRALYEELSSLLRDGERTGETLEKAIAGAALDWADGSSHIGRRIGAYEVTGLLGRGGMGAVYLAVRADDEYRKEVAVKLIRPGGDDAEIRRRFLVERQILANLDHPGIARLLDGGTTEDASPYVVMERVNGEPIDRYCDRGRLSIDARLRLFRRICEAVQFAHRNLVVHRDIKPANILVTGDGAPKLLDFGIAKLLDATGDTAATASAVRLLTPEYASPEQLRGDPITTATDVYSLGVLLYELLTGVRPFRPNRHAPHEIERAIVEQQPDRPSGVALAAPAADAGHGRPETSAAERSRLRALTPERLRRRLAGDLDNIVLMAMRKEPARRYASVDQLSEDVRRHLDGLPVIARADTVGYRAGKFVRRHRGGVIGAAATVVLVAAVVTFYTWRLTAERDRARAEAAKAQQVTEFLVGVFESSDPTSARGLTITAQEILASGRDRVNAELRDQPEARASVLAAIGRVYQSLGAYDSAAVMLDSALAIRRDALGEEHPDYATSMTLLGQLAFDRNDLDAAERFAREALRWRRAHFGDADPSVATTLANLASALQSKGDLEAADTLYRDALAIRRRLLGPEHRFTATSINNLGALLDDQGDLAAADSLYREALRIRRTILPPDDYDLAVSLNNVGRISEQLGDLAGADSLYRESLAIRRRIFDGDHPAVLRVVNNLAGVHLRRGDFAAAEAAYREVVAVWRERGDPTSAAIPLNNLGVALSRQERHRDAIAALEESLALQTRAVGDDHPSLAFMLNGLGSAYRALGDRRRSEGAYLRAIELRRTHLPPGHPSLAPTLAGLAGLRMDEGAPAAAEPLYREALEITRASTPDDAVAIADAERQLAGALVALERYGEADALLLASYPVLRDQAGVEDRRTVQVLQLLVRSYDRRGLPDADRYRRLLSGRP